MEYGESIDLCPNGQKDASGKTSTEWLTKRDKFVITGTTFGDCVPKGHLFKGDGSPRSVVARYACNRKEETTPFRQRSYDTGNIGESIAVPRFAEQGKYTLLYPGLLASKTHDYWGGSPDGVCVKDRFIVECKTLALRKFEYDDNGKAKVLTKHLAQANFYMYLTGYRKCAFVQFEPVGDVTHVKWLDYDEENMRTAIAHAELVTNEAIAVKKAIAVHIARCKDALESIKHTNAFVGGDAEKEACFLALDDLRDRNCPEPLDKLDACREILHKHTLQYLKPFDNARVIVNTELAAVEEIFQTYTPRKQKRKPRVSTVEKDKEYKGLEINRVDDDLLAACKRFKKLN